MKILMYLDSFFRRILNRKKDEPEVYDDTVAMNRLVNDQIASINWHTTNGKAKTQS